jgi:L-malate glycosyltransferase
VVAGVAGGRRRLRRIPYDIVNTHFVLPSGPVGAAVARAAGVPNVVTVHGGDLYDPSKRLSPHRHGVLRACVRALLKRADRVVGQSSDTIANMRRFYLPDWEVVRIPLGIRRPPPGTAARGELGFRDEDVLLITVGRLVARKAVEQLVDMMVRLDAGTHLIVLGTGPLEAGLRERAKQRGVGHRTHFLGWVDEAEKFRLLRMADVFVSTSQHEGFGLVFLEAMACGLPVVCYDHGGQTDFLESGVTGCVLPLNDAAAFERGCRALIADPSLRKRTGAANADRVEDYYADTCARRYEAVFEEAIEMRRAGRKFGHARPP